MAQAKAEVQTRTAEELATQQKQISVSEFFEKNRHLLGYDNKIKALLIIVKEGVDNALDACEEARILPDIFVKIEELDKEKYKVIIKDNGPGIIESQIPKIFGVLLYGSKFHRLRQNRGAQGLGISCAVLYSQLTTGEPTEIISSTGKGKAHKYKLMIDVKNNAPKIIEKQDMPATSWKGVQITFICEGIYREHKQSVLEYIKQTAISNPFANIVFESPTGKYEFFRGVKTLAPEPKEIQPHLHGVEVGIMIRMLQETTARSVQGFLTTEFTRVGSKTAADICSKAGLDPRISPKRVTDEQVRSIIKAVKEVDLTRPPTDCLSPLGDKLIQEGLKKELNPEFLSVVSRPPTVYRGFPFQVEAGLAFGGGITEPKIMRFANRVPLLYQQGDCAITKAIEETDWKRYGVDAEKLPTAPIGVFVHLCSVWVPFTSESKEAIASYPIILKELKLALQEAGRDLYRYLAGKRRAEYQAERIRIFERYAEETAKSISELTDVSAEKVKKEILKLIESRKKGPLEGDEIIPEEELRALKEEKHGKRKAAGNKEEAE